MRVKNTLAFIAIWSSFNAVAMGQALTAKDCSTLRYLRHKSSCLCGKVSVCSGDVCLRPSQFGLDNDFEVLLRDNQGNVLDSKKLSYQAEQSSFCFDNQRDGKYEIAFV